MLFRNPVPIVLALLIAVSFTSAQNNDKKLNFSHPHGFYNSPFVLEISGGISGAKIRYTLDGTNPLTSASATECSSPVSITVDPSITGNRDKAPGYIVTACAVLNDTLVSKIITQTYLFPNRIVELSPNNQVPGSGWLVPGSKPQKISYGLDPRVYTDPAYEKQMITAFTSIPSLSIVTDLKNLFNSDSGIYVNAQKHSEDWEREVSLELLNPDSTEGFQINCGLRIRGGYSRRTENPKHAFRVFFRDTYGKAKLEYPVFGDEGVKEFDKFDIQTAMNYAWAYEDASVNIHNTFLREIFSRDTQRDMGQPYTRGKYCHLYINGSYFGLYQIQERSEASFAASYFGGSQEDYDVIKVNVGDYFNIYDIEATDGTLDKWRALWDAGQKGFMSDEAYFKVQGMNADGTVNPAYTKLLDVDNLIDYMLVTFFTGDFDGPISGFSGNTNPNNFYAIYNRVTPDGFKFFRHDSEHSMFLSDVNGWGVDRTGPFNAGSYFNKSNPQWIHQKLSSNAKYRLRFADHVYKHFFNGGVLTLQQNLDRLNKRRQQIEAAIIAESARWGDSKSSQPRTKADWINAVNYITQKFLPGRNAIVLEQLKGKSLFVTNDPPGFNTFGGVVEKGFNVELSAGTGKIYYTTDGTDPYSKSAIEYKTPIVINKTTTIKTRTLTGLNWSPLCEATFVVKGNLNSLKVTELHYHPLDQDTVSDKYFEFIELKNCGGDDISLLNSRFLSGIDYTFGNKTLAPGGFIVLASDKDQFNKRYGFMPYDSYSGQLDNSGEKIVFADAAGDTIFAFSYKDKSPWPEEADGKGYSLVSISHAGMGNPADADYWTKSAGIHGSPGKDDPSSGVEELKDASLKGFILMQNYPNPFNPSTVITYQLPKGYFVDLKVYNLLGQEVASLINKYQPAGQYKVQFDAGNLPSGLYFYRIKAGDFTQTQKMLLIR